MPSISSSADQTQNIVIEQIQNNNNSSDEDNNTTTSANTPSTKGRGRKATSLNVKEKRNTKVSKEHPDENENCRVSFSIRIHLKVHSTQRNFVINRILFFFFRFKSRSSHQHSNNLMKK